MKAYIESATDETGKPVWNIMNLEPAQVMALGVILDTVNDLDMIPEPGIEIARTVALVADGILINAYNNKITGD